MLQGDLYFRTKQLSDVIETLKLEDDDPDNQYLLKTTVIETGKRKWINRAELDAKYKPASEGIQTKLFTHDRREKVRETLKKR